MTGHGGVRDGAGRPPVEGEPRDTWIKIRVTVAEAEAVAKAAAAAGMTQSALIRDAVADAVARIRGKKSNR